jgi:hypothetical protein
VTGKLAQVVSIASHEEVFGDDDDGVPEIGQHFEAATSDLKPPLNRLVRVGHAAHRQHLRLPLRGGKLLSKEIRGVLLHEDFGFEVEPCGEPEVLMRGTSKTITASMLASPIRIDARVEADIGACVV